MKTMLCFLLLIFQLLFFVVATAEVSSDDYIDSDDTAVDAEIRGIALDVANEVDVVVNEVHGVVSSRLLNLSDQIDNFFVAKRMDDEGSNTRVVYSYYVSEDIHGNVEHGYFITAQLSFPKTEDRLRLVLESSPDSSQGNEGNSVVGSVNDERNLDLSAALQLIFAKNEKWQVSSKIGMNLVIPLDPFARLRIRRLFYYDDWVMRMVETFFLSRDLGFGESSKLELERPATDWLYFRSRSELIYAQKADDVNFTQRFSFYHRKTDKIMWVYSVGSEIVARENPHIERNYINVRFRHNFYKKWAFYEVVPELSFDSENDFDMLPIILLKLDIVFGKV